MAVRIISRRSAPFVAHSPIVRVGGHESASVNASSTPPSGGVQPFFEDDFSSGNLNKTANGFSWTGVRTPTYAAQEIQVVNDIVFPGDSYSLGFRYAPGDSGNDQYFQLATPGNGYPELWMEYYLHVPANFVHTSTDIPNNNKMWSLYGEVYEPNTNECEFTCEYTRVDANTSRVRLSVFHGDAWLGGLDSDAGHTVMDNVWDASHHGTWVRFRVHARVAVDGRLRVWRDSVLIYDKVANSFTTGGINHLRNGYLMGSANGSFSADTYFHIARVKFYSQDPGW